MWFYKKIFLFVFVFQLSHLQGQVFVHEEPRHHLVFQNKEVRILNVIIPPGDTTQYHIHHTPSVFIFFTKTLTGSQLKGKSPSFDKSKAGRIIFENLAPPNIRIHRVWNADADTFHVMDVELLVKDTGFALAPFAMPDLKLEINTAWARVYRLTLLRGKEFSLSNYKQSFILISFNSAIVETNYLEKKQYLTLKQGSFFDIKENELFSIKNTSDATAQFVLFEMPFK
jgi:hypothetical protein